jgi:hypothetical protein
MNSRCHSHIYNPNCVVVHLRPGSTEQHNTAISGVVDHIVAHDAVKAAHTNSIGPFLESIGSAWTNVVILNGDVVAVEGSFLNVKARPTSWIERVNIFNELIRVLTSHLDIRSSLGGRCASTSAIDLSNQLLCEQDVSMCPVGNADLYVPKFYSRTG